MTATEGLVSLFVFEVNSVLSEFKITRNGWLSFLNNAICLSVAVELFLFFVESCESFVCICE